MKDEWVALAPSNIALIKYMGKVSGGLNIPSNASLSYTLDHFTTTVRMTLTDKSQDSWQCLEEQSLRPLQLSDSAQDRFLNHLARIKQLYDNEDSWLVESANNFPHAAGIASSASSFAALTQCAVKACAQRTNKTILSIAEQASLSRQGSGSSCRSFYKPWGMWEGENCYAIDLPYKSLHHQLIILDDGVKSVSSSEAHLRVCSSVHFQTRAQRAQKRLDALVNSLRSFSWKVSYEICFEEFMDMHNLFATCSQPFHYITPVTKVVLNKLKSFWQVHQDGPIVTMDAGANIHLLYRLDQIDLAQSIKENLLHDFIVI